MFCLTKHVRSEKTMTSTGESSINFEESTFRKEIFFEVVSSSAF